MSRTLIRKLLYPALIAVGVAGMLFAARRFELSLWQILVFALILLLPGRVAGFVFRDFFRGLNLLRREKFDAALRNFDGFIEMIRAKPGRKKFIWFLWGMYTSDIEAMALNNRGIIHLHAGRFAPAREDLERAIQLDAGYAKAFYNLALLEYVSGNASKAERDFARSEALGFKGTTYDRLIQEGALLLARIEGRGTSAP